MMSIVDILLHLDSYLRILATDYGVWVYAALFVVIFCETGLVVTPFLPGDSILFMIGTLSAVGIMSLGPAIALLAMAAIIGDTVNYHIGAFIGPKAFKSDEAKFFKKRHLGEAQAFYEKWGGAAVVLGRFMPIIRTFVPFAAGIGSMRYFKFLAFNALGGILWVLLLCLSGYFFGNVPFVQKNLTLIIYGIVFISLIPAAVGFVHARLVVASRDIFQSLPAFTSSELGQSIARIPSFGARKTNRANTESRYVGQRSGDKKSRESARDFRLERQASERRGNCRLLIRSSEV